MYVVDHCVWMTSQLKSLSYSASCLVKVDLDDLRH